MRRLKHVSYIFSPVVLTLIAGVLFTKLEIGSRIFWAIIMLAGLFLSIVNSIVVVIFVIKK